MDKCVGSVLIKVFDRVLVSALLVLWSKCFGSVLASALIES